MKNYKLLLLEEKYSILKMHDKNDSLSWLDSHKWHSITKTDDEISVLCLENCIPQDIKADVEKGWRCFKLEGVLDFSLTGVLSGILAVLAENKISILTLSTYNTDYVLVKDEKLEMAIAALLSAGYEINNNRR